MSALRIARNAVRRYTRDRSALFFMVVLPVLIIVIIGATVTGFDRFRIAVVVEGDGPRTSELVEALRGSDAFDVTVLDSADEAAVAVRRSEQSIGVVIPRSYDRDLAAGERSRVLLVGERTSNSFIAAEAAVRSVVSDQAGLVQAARFGVERNGGGLDDQLAVARRLADSTPRITATAQQVGAGRGEILPQGFSYSAPTQLVLFVFINALAGGAAVIESRRTGIYERIAVSPVSRWSIVAGETLAYLALALLQSILIVGVGGIFFGVDWGSPIAATALVLVWALVGTGTGVLAGTLFRTPEQATSVGPPLGIVAGMLGGCMWPLEIVPGPMKTLGHLFPHAWAIDAWTILLSKEGGLVDIAPQLLILLGYAAVLLAVATLRLRKHLVTR